MDEWRPIDEATPKRADKPILLWFPWEDVPNPAHDGACGDMYIGVWAYGSEDDDNFGRCWRDPSVLEALGEPSRWMPLPKPPKS